MSVVVENQAKLHRWLVWFMGRQIAKQLGVKEYVLSGSYRRGESWCNDIDLLIKINSDEEQAGLLSLVEKIGWMPRLDRRVSEDVFSHQFTKNTERGVVVLDLFLARPDFWGNALVFTTGPKSFNDKIRENIIQTGYSWSNPKYFTHIRSGRQLCFSEEASALNFLGVKGISPRKRM